jgi:phage tail-like protein
VTGLASELEPIDFREGEAEAPRMVGTHKPGNVVLKRGIVLRESGFWDWWPGALSGPTDRRTVLVTLLDEAGDPLVSWEIAGAWPVKLDGPGPGTKGDEVAVETLELAYEHIRVLD